MGRRTTLSVLLLMVPIFASPALGQIDLEGTWDLQASGVIPPEAEPCVFEGSGEMTQSGDQLAGQATLLLVSGPAVCPAEMAGNIMGQVEGSSLFGMLDGGEQFGGLNFDGTVSNDGSSIEGTYDVKPEGPFSNVTDGTWSAAVQQQVSVLEIPTVGAWGLALLTALLALTSLLVLRQWWA